MLSAHFQQFGVQRFIPQKPVVPGTPVVIGEPEDTDGTAGTGSVGGTTETDETKQKEAYEKALKEATEELENEFKENYRNVSNLNEVSPLSKTFEVNGKTYSVTVKPTYYKQDDGTYSLYNKDEMKMATGWKPKFEVTTDEISDNDKIRDNENGDVNVDYSCDKPINWKKEFGKYSSSKTIDVSGNTIFETEGDAKILYDGNKLAQHMPEKIINQFFIEDETHKGGYKLADNVKSINLISNDENGNPRYEITYTDENGEEMFFSFDVIKRGDNISTSRENLANQTLKDLQNEADKLDKEYDTAMKSLDDLCKQYGVKNNVMIKQIAGTNSKDLDARIESCKQYISTMEENVATVNTEIDKIKTKYGKDDKTDNTNTDTKPVFEKDKMLKWMQSFAASKTYNTKAE